MRLRRVVIVGLRVVKDDSDSLFARQNASFANPGQKRACFLRVCALTEHAHETVLGAAEIRDAAVNRGSSNAISGQHNPDVVVGAFKCLSASLPRIDTSLVDVAKRASSLDELRKLDYELVFVGFPPRCLSVLVGVIGVAVLNVVLPVELPKCAWMHVHTFSLPDGVHPLFKRPSCPLLQANGVFKLPRE